MSVTETFLNPLRAHFKDPQVADIRLFYLDLASQLSRYSDDTLERAAASLKMYWDRKHRFPPLNECVAACDRAVRTPMDEDRLERLRLDRERRQKEQEADLPAVHEWAKRKISGHPMGRLAASEGWIVKLYDFIRIEARFPGEEEQKKLKEEDKYTRLRMREMKHGAGVFGKFADGFCQAYFDKVQRLSDVVFQKEGAE